MAMQNLSFHKGIILNPLNDKKCEFFAEGVLVIKGKGTRAKIADVLSAKEALKKYGKRMTSRNTVNHDSSVIMPAFFDMHFHWVQDDVRQMPKDSLLQWLEKYTFPTEMKFADKAHAKAKAREFFRKIIQSGTLGGACYSSIHEHAVIEAMKEVKGDFLIGNVLMDMNSPEELTQTEKEALSITKRLIKKFKRRYIFTPRFAIATSPKVMKEGSALADKARCFKQSHLSETPGEIEFVLSLYRKMPGFEDVQSYTEIYQRTGMLGKRSLMGHGIHLSPRELKILSQTKTALIHCPTSNAPWDQQGLGSGLFNFKQIEKAKVRWAMGSDIGGGPFLSMFDVMRSFVEQNRAQNVSGATFVKALYRSTLAGAEIMEVNKRTGNLSKGKEPNFIVVPLEKGARPRNAEKTLEKIINPLARRREEYDSLVSYAHYRGKKLYNR